MFEEDLVSWLVEAYQQQLGSDRSLNVMRLVSVLGGQVTTTEVRQILDLPERERDDELNMLFDRGLIDTAGDCLVARSLVWTEGQRRGRWMDRLGGKPAEMFEAYIRSSPEAAAKARLCWSNLAVYFPSLTVDGVLSKPLKRHSGKKETAA